MIDVARSSNPRALALLRLHPKVLKVEDGGGQGIAFRQGNWEREVLRGIAASELYGLVELMDNNPLVCADRMSIPTPIGVLAAIALGPLIASDLLYEPPTILASSGDDQVAIDHLLIRMGWAGGAVVHADEHPFGGAIAATVIAAINTPARLEDIDEVYAERFERSFFVHENDQDEWDVQLVQNSQNALFRLRIAPDDPVSLLTIRVMADREGKCGAGAMVHAMNVMAGLEESLGLSQ